MITIAFICSFPYAAFHQFAFFSAANEICDVYVHTHKYAHREGEKDLHKMA